MYPVWSWTCCVTETDLELPECWDYRHAWPGLVSHWFTFIISETKTPHRTTLVRNDSCFHGHLVPCDLVCGEQSLLWAELGVRQSLGWAELGWVELGVSRSLGWGMSSVHAMIPPCVSLGLVWCIRFALHRSPGWFSVSSIWQWKPTTRYLNPCLHRQGY